MNDIDEALEDPAVSQRLDEQQLEEVQRLRQEGEEAHRAGDHAASEEALRQAKDILGIS